MNIEQQLKTEREKFRSIQQIARAVGSTLHLDQVLNLIVEKLTELMDAERSTLYLLDNSGQELWTKVLQADELREIHLAVGEGIAGWVAQAGKTVNIEDAYQDKRFNPDVDKRSGYRTRSILCLPMKDSKGKIIGVVQVLNKRGGPFTSEDEDLLEALACQAGIAIETSKLYMEVYEQNIQLRETQEQLKQRMRELDLLLEVEKQTNAAASLEELIDSLLARTSDLVGAEAGSILLQDEKSGRQLRVSKMVGDHREVVFKQTVEPGQGIVGWVALHGQPCLLKEPAQDPRHDKELKSRIGFEVRGILCVPLIGQEKILGAIELLNKAGQEQFEDSDLTLLTLIAGRISQAIELARAKDEKIKQEQLAQIGQALSGLLHDLKTPITIASGFAQLMAGSDSPEERAEYSDQIFRQFDLLSAMTKEVLAFARGESNLLVRKIYLHKFIDEMRRHLEHEFAGKKIEMTIEPIYRGIAFFDETKFRRVFHNIARNAAEAMPDGGTFSLIVDTEADKLKFIFRDTGMGIPAELEGRLFQTFATAGKKNGTGLGLAIVHKIVEEHQGKIICQSQKGQGTTFTITIPLERPFTPSGNFPSVNS